MKLLLDQDVYVFTERFLRSLGHDVVTASQLGQSRATDTDLLLTAAAQDRIFVTRDRDFGNLVFVSRLGNGVVYLRMTPSNKDDIHAELQHVLTTYSRDALSHAFVVVEVKRHRFRSLKR